MDIEHRRELHRQSYHRHREEILERRRLRRTTRTPEEIEQWKEYHHRYYEEHKLENLEKSRKQALEYARTHKEIRKKWAEEHPEKMREYHKRYYQRHRAELCQKERERYYKKKSPQDRDREN